MIGLCDQIVAFRLAEQVGRVMLAYLITNDLIANDGAKGGRVGYLRRQLDHVSLGTNRKSSRAASAH